MNSEEDLSHPLLLLSIAGIALALGTGVLLVAKHDIGAGVAGAAATAIGITLTAMIAKKQLAASSIAQKTLDQTLTASSDAKESLDQTMKLVQQIAERDSERDYHGVPEEGVSEEGVSEEDGSVEGQSRPHFAEYDETKNALCAKGVTLSCYENLVWEAKKPTTSKQGNYGWFVSYPGSDDNRWFVRRARGLAVRKAMPKSFLEAWKRDEGVTAEKLKPTDIAHDYQIKQHGLAAWYVRTYSNKLFRVSRSNRNSEIQVSEIVGE